MDLLQASSAFTDIEVLIIYSGEYHLMMNNLRAATNQILLKVIIGFIVVSLVLTGVATI